MESSASMEKSGRTAALLWSLLGAIHVFVFAAAFPFFSVVDEQAHLDLVVRYSHGDVPRSLTPVTQEALPFIAIYGTSEYLWPGGTNLPPPWKQPMASVKPQLVAKETAYLQHFQNHEAASPPLYYSLAGAWWRLGRWLNLDGAPLLYWLRFLNVPLMAALVWLGWRTARGVFPENAFIQMAVPALIAFLPQTALYAINSEILVPLTFGAVFVMLLKCWDAEALSARLGALTGLAFAAAYLTKGTNLPLLAAAALFLALKILALRRDGRLRESFGPLLILLLTAGLPIAAWMLWCKLNFGDFTGAQAKVQFLGWTVKPFAEWFHHPLFSGAGFWTFLKENIATFWQGEMLWQRQPLALPKVDSTYVVLSLGTFTLALAAWGARPSPFTSFQRAALSLSFLCVFACFAFYALLSVQYDFHDCFRPSREHPFFTAGRMMLGMLVPFLLLFACGLDRLMYRFQNSTKFTVLLGLLIFMAASEITIDTPIFTNEYNWYHL